jgi:hypothetical protein
MDITFSLQNGQYIAEFKVTSEFNLHIEKGVGTMQMLQRTSGTFFDKVEDFKMEKGDVVYDFDSGSFIGEKTIRLVSSVEPRYCFITTSGEVTEIKSQSKEVEVTSNGTMDITPDAGFSYLNSVKVKTNVAQSGEGGASTMEYLDLRGEATAAHGAVSVFSLLAVADGGVRYIVAPTSYLILNGIINETSLPRCVAIDFSAKVDLGGIKSVREAILEMSVSADALASLPRLTKEEFYSFNTSE